MKNFLILLLFSGTLVFCSVSFAEEKEKPEFPQRGTLSSSFDAGYSEQAINQPVGGDLFGNTAPPPISGSVSRVGADEWKALVKNNTEDKYRASFQVRQYNKKGRMIKSASFSATLKAGEQMSRNFRAAAGSVRGELKLNGWKNLSPPPPPAEEEEEALTPESAIRQRQQQKQR